MESEYGPDIVTVEDEDGVKHTFEELDRIETADGKFLALTPVFDESQELLDDDGELIIVRVSDEDGDTYLEPIENQKQYDEIGAIFEERLRDLFFIKKEDEEE